MTTLYRNATWYRPYYCEVNNKTYRIDNLIIYKDGKILVQTGSWFEDKHGRDIEMIKLPVDKIVLRRKEKFNGEVFAITHKETYGTETQVDVYIPFDMLNIHFVEYKIMYKQLRAIYEGEQNIYITSTIENLDTHKWEIEREYEELYKQVDDFALRNRTDDNGEHLFELLDKMKELVTEWIEEKQRVDNLTVDDDFIQKIIKDRQED